MNRLLAFVFAISVTGAIAQEPPTALAHPPFDAFYACAEHFEGQLPALGDALGTDCVVYKLNEVNGRVWMRAYANEGLRNEDWFGWNTSVLSPCDCTVSAIHENPKENEPGHMIPGRASSIELRRADGVHFVIAHVRSITVRKGEQVKAGQTIAGVGNNGYSRNPHIHIGAWKDKTPLQLRFDQSKMKLPPEFRAQEAQHRP